LSSGKFLILNIGLLKVSLNMQQALYNKTNVYKINLVKENKRMTQTKDSLPDEHSVKQRNYTPLIVILSIAVNVLVAILFFLPGYKGDWEHFDITILPMFNAIFNSFTFLFLLL